MLSCYFKCTKKIYVINEVEYNYNYLNQLNELARMNIPTRSGLKNLFFIAFFSKEVNVYLQNSSINQLKFWRKELQNSRTK